MMHASGAHSSCPDGFASGAPAAPMARDTSTMSQKLDDIAELSPDFPVEPEAGAAWLWSAGADRLLWASTEGARLGGDAVSLGEAGQRFLAASPAGQRLRAIAEGAPARRAVSMERLRFFFGRATEVVTCICQPVALRKGGWGVLAVRMGAPARKPRTPAPVPDAGANVAAPAVDIPVPVASASGPVADLLLASIARPAAVVVSPPAPAVAETPPAWTEEEPARRRPRRFVWQTDAAGRFVHVSRELAEAVGPAQGVPVGLTWAELAERFAVGGAAGIARALSGRDTWSGERALWPVGGADLAVPVEFAGVPVLDQDRIFQGHRGYGIARIERAEAWIRPAQATTATAVAVAVPVGTGHIDEPEEDDADEAEEALLPVEPPEETDGVIAAAPFDEEAADAAMLGSADAELEPEEDYTDEEVAESVAASDERDEPAEASVTLAVNQPALPESGDDRAASADADTSDGEDEAGLMTKADADTVEIAVPAPQAPAPVTPLRPPGFWSAGVLPARGQPGSGTSPLNPAERSAFSEIARVLGARFEGAADASGTAAEPPRPTPQPEPAAEQPRHETDIPRAGLRAVPRDPLTAAAPDILDRAPIGLLVLQDGRTMYVNRTLLDLLGHQNREVFEIRGGVGTLFKGRAPEAVAGEQRPLPLVDSHGNIVEVEAVLHAIGWDGRPASLVSFRRAAVEAGMPARLKAAELDLQGVRRELSEIRTVLDTAVDGVVTIDRAGRIIGLNRPAEALFGYDQGELVGEPFAVLFRPDSQKTVAEYLSGLSGNSVATVMNDGREVEGRERNGGTIPLFMTLGRIGEVDVGPARFCAVLREMTHWKKAEAELTDARRKAEQASAQKSDFLARISHEVRTPLNAIIGFSQVMLSETHGPVGNDRYKEYLKDINMSGEHVMSLVNDLLDLSKIEAGRMELAFTSVDLNIVIGSCVQLMQPQANSARVLIRTQLAHRLPPVVADERSIRQIVLNLLSNATKFTDAGGQVIVSTSLSERGEAVVRVRDTGVGMSEKEVKEAMQPFYQSAATRGRGGTGLGLPLTKALVEANRANFSLKSEPKAGTLVEVIFPATRVLAE
jgi:PAS domain S-box-containing protein